LQELEIEDAVQQVVAEAWEDYLAHHQGGSPPGFSSLSVAQATLKGKAIATLLDQKTWAGIVQRIGNVYKPTPASSEDFLAHLDQYAGGVASAACDGNDGYRLFRSSGASLLWQLSPDGTWAKLIYQPDAPQPPANVQWTPVPGAPRSYIASVPTANPRSPFGPPLERITGELTVGPDATRRSCLTDESTTETANFQAAVSMYEAIQQNAGWIAVIPQARFIALLPKFSGHCASTTAVYTPWTSGPVVSAGIFAISNRASYIAAYTATASAATISRWQRVGTDWLPGVAFAGPTFNNGGDDVLPRLAISGDGMTVAGCWISGPRPGSGFESLAAIESAGIQRRHPEVFHFADGSITYPSTGTTDPQACSRVSLNEAGDRVWYQQKDLAPNWFASSTIAANAKPLLLLPDGPTVEAEGPLGGEVSYAASAKDGYGQVATQCSPASGAVFPLGSSLVTCTATNDFGTTTGAFPVTVRDTIAPSVSAPASPYVVEALGPNGAAAPSVATANDSVDGDVPVSCTPAVGTVLGLGGTQVDCTASDQAGNAATQSFEVLVVDSTGPVFTEVPNVFAPAKGPFGGSAGFAAPVAFDLVDGPVSATCTPGGASIFPIGATNVNCLATDAHGNGSSVTFEVIITPISIATPGTVFAAAKDSTGKRVVFKVTARDELNGRKVKAVCTPPSGTVFPLGDSAVHCAASDGNGASNSTFTISVRDVKPPVISHMPHPAGVEATSADGATVNYRSPDVSDNVDGTDPVICLPPSGSTFPVGKTVVTCVATDVAGNSSRRTFTAVVRARR
jgi:hypothetical protein